MFDIEQYKRTMKQLMPSWSQEQIDKDAAWMAAKYDTVRNGPEVLHLSYFGGILSDDDLNNINIETEKAGLMLSSFDKSGISYASFDNFLLHFSINLSQETSNFIISAASGVAGNMVWESIKKITTLIWIKTKDKFLNKSQNKKVTKKPINVGLKVYIKEDKYDFQIPRELEDHDIQEALDKIPEFIKQRAIPENVEEQSHTILNYNISSKIWFVVDIDDEIRKISSGQVNK